MDKREKSKMEEDLVISTIQVLSGKTKADPSPDELESLRKLIKKNVPFTLRGYFMAYLLREILQANTPRRDQGRQQARPKATARTDADKSRPQSRQRTVPEGSRTLYLNIGKMKRLYAKELSQILQDELSIGRDDIHSIRIHDKYSFITMSEEHCEKAIEKLNGMDIKGRTAAISYSNRE